MSIENRKPYQDPYNSRGSKFRRSKERVGEYPVIRGDSTEMSGNRSAFQNLGPFPEVSDDRPLHKLI